MSTHNTPFRYDTVGSFLRPEFLKQARSDFAAGKIDRAALTTVEDDAIKTLIFKQVAAGYKSVSDGEFRRSYWHLDFFWGLNGAEHAQGGGGGEQFHAWLTKPDSVQLVGKLDGHNHPFVEHFKFMAKHVPAGVVVKQTIPAPAQLLFELDRPNNQRTVNRYYDTRPEFLDDIVAAYRLVISDLYRAGLRNLQLDDCTWGTLAGALDTSVTSFRLTPAQLQATASEYSALNNRVTDGWPADLIINTHVCRGNFHSDWAGKGAYDPIARPLFTDSNYHAFYLEYDTERAGGFEPLTQVPDDKYVVLGLITSKFPQLEDRQHIIDRIHEAAQYHPLDKLCLSPQCGFASTEEGNILNESEQFAKLALVKSIAEEVWGPEGTTD
ncbi:5-methyltetrahydropteroyltriglutamate--homocysteine S-methyltransferase [Lacticaseibacillus sharpeae]|uniref:Methionine synthase, vitamin-B12 independent n=1 Tax=Lacticaseibacillus sharpeae JCM 1186 = DSM 20505 TaxID=1291052 RepID=A0A0R1ZNY2_9LACO|nr:5-methyltetrahydropteroyltriglutamate--homocysteine S-methyltransferase [Lacticaseibacillus sharpeae]KRM56271.1 methionine synthase, vitamin-B12 independent [Lacticaseibacillus sharpeae JCM 1186 = DSM 20505]